MRGAGAAPVRHVAEEGRPYPDKGADPAIGFFLSH